MNLLARLIKRLVSGDEYARELIHQHLAFCFGNESAFSAYYAQFTARGLQRMRKLRKAWRQGEVEQCITLRICGFGCTNLNAFIVVVFDFELTVDADIRDRLARDGMSRLCACLVAVTLADHLGCGYAHVKQIGCNL